MQANWEHRQPPAIKRQREDADALTSLNSPALANQPREGGSHSTGMWHSLGDAEVAKQATCFVKGRLTALLMDV